MGWFERVGICNWMVRNKNKSTLVDISIIDSQIGLNLRWMLGLRYGRKIRICDIRYWLILYELKIYLIFPTPRNLDRDSNTNRSPSLSVSVWLLIEWINRWNQKIKKRGRIQITVWNHEMEDRKSYGFTKTLWIESSSNDSLILLLQLEVISYFES